MPIVLFLTIHTYFFLFGRVRYAQLFVLFFSLILGTFDFSFFLCPNLESTSSMLFI